MDTVFCLCQTSPPGCQRGMPGTRHGIPDHHGDYRALCSRRLQSDGWTESEIHGGLWTLIVNRISVNVYNIVGLDF